MKLIIDIPDNEYKQNRYYYDGVYHGTPLDDVIEEYVERGAITENMKMLDKIDSIKAEIDYERNWYLDIVGDSGYCNGLNKALKIIDKHICKAESEDI